MVLATAYKLREGSRRSSSENGHASRVMRAVAWRCLGGRDGEGRGGTDEGVDAADEGLGVAVVGQAVGSSCTHSAR